MLQNIPCTLVTGFLGSGKTTLINQLIATKPLAERWALLINEFGRIGIDGALLTSSQDSHTTHDIAIREVSGGCICCTSQLPLQIALSRLLSDHHPKRLLIEPTGLAHPRELVQQLSAPHWQTALKMQAVITVLSALQWQQEKYRTHEGFQAQISIIWAESDKQITTHKINTSTGYSAALSAQLFKPSFVISKQQRVNIAEPYRAVVGLKPLSHSLTANTFHNPESNDANKPDTSVELPYRYHEQQQDILLAGWRLPAEYVLDADKLQDWLLKLLNWQRIKGVVHTSHGWLQINFTPDSLSTKTVSAQVDSRLEIILQASTEQEDATAVKVDWEVYDLELMALML